MVAKVQKNIPSDMVVIKEMGPYQSLKVARNEFNRQVIKNKDVRCILFKSGAREYKILHIKKFWYTCQ